MKTISIQVIGRVQGVYFRAFTQKKAVKLGIYGFVQNLSDGSVYIEAQGESDALDQLIAWCHKGPLMAKVQQVNVAQIAPTDHNGFTIR
jgi:acylphosphatase